MARSELTGLKDAAIALGAVLTVMTVWSFYDQKQAKIKAAEYARKSKEETQVLRETLEKLVERLR